ncbi:unnamed protein product [Brassicogethes aeneus]|uniref:BMP-binding endothelial regulator protein n=1 Tax=Brassicogethes aeneus TaxID=1431903 RepID=A0A9P0FGX8_BRAAE|nr:unnamed protein product [Brassicogethes aeneus]
MEKIIGLLLIFFIAIALCNAQNLEGKRIKCFVEGALIPHGLNMSCITCLCKNGYVDCGGCPRTDDCFLLEKITGCCKRCKGCFYKGMYYQSNTDWTDPKSPCTTLRCEAGIVTESDMICHTPCANPLPPEPGKCCSTCPECKINGQIASEDRDVIYDDPCLKCSCANNRMTCAKKACPVLQCPFQNQYHAMGECCPKCRGKREMIRHDKSCLIQSFFYKQGESLYVDKCTNCTCSNETSICTRNACPILDCTPDMQRPISGSCCKQCKVPEEVRTQCFYNGKSYEDGESWNLNECSSCKCHQGKPSCAKTKCNKTNCPPGASLRKLPGECCPKCEEADGVCMVFGDPHYKTFDGKLYDFKGNGKYQLTADCRDKSFYIKVANTINKSLSSSKTKRVTVKYSDIRVNLQQKTRVKVNGTLIKIPYHREGKLRITKSRDNIEVTLENGVKLMWNGRSFLEVSVPASYKNKLCGLCGNFNGNVQDDFIAKNGRLMRDNETNIFGSTWCVGNKRDCAKKVKPGRSCLKHNVPKKCNLLGNSQIFEKCDSKLSPSFYYNACKVDGFNCIDENWYCESFIAYARECERLGALIPKNWKNFVSCDGRKKKMLKNRYMSSSSPKDMMNLLRETSHIKLSKRIPIPLHN